MARIIHFLATGALLIGGSVALGQTTERSGAAAQASGQATAVASANQNEQSASLAAGTAVNAQLSQTIDSKKAKAGEPVTAQTTDAVKSDGKVIIPKGTKLIGHVTRASARSKGDADSTLAMRSQWRSEHGSAHGARPNWRSEFHRGRSRQCCGPNAGRFDCVRRVDTDEPRRLRDQWFKPEQQCRELDGRIGDYFRRQECAA